MSLLTARRVLATVACSTVGLIGVNTQAAKAEPVCVGDVHVGGGEIVPGQDWGNIFVEERCTATPLNTACSTVYYYPIPVTPLTTPPGASVHLCHPVP